MFGARWLLLLVQLLNGDIWGPSIVIFCLPVSTSCLSSSSCFSPHGHRKAAALLVIYAEMRDKMQQQPHQSLLSGREMLSQNPSASLHICQVAVTCSSLPHPNCRRGSYSLFLELGERKNKVRKGDVIGDQECVLHISRGFRQVFK